MTIRSLLFVPGDSERKLAKGAASGADALILDLEDSVAPEQKVSARQRVRAYLQAYPADRPSQLWVRINSIDTPLALEDLAAVVAARPDGIMQPKARGVQDFHTLSQRLAELEREAALTVGTIGILPVATEVPRAIFTLGEYTQAGARLRGLTWGAEDLSAAVGATANKELDGRWTPPYQIARALTLFAAASAGVTAIDTLFADFRDEAGLRASCTEARRDGFGGKLAIHPEQIAVINECFLPTTAELAHAERVVDLFRANPGVAALSLDGSMVDLPHLRQAQAILARTRNR
jgi:citrate lyase subunit beta/citryl-CoA lyase